MDPGSDDVQTVRIGPATGPTWRAGAALLVAVLVVLVAKPWSWADGGDAPSATPRAGAPSPTPDLGESYIVQGSRPYDPSLFGAYEARPAWELWPAGYIVEIGIAGPLPVAVGIGAGESGPPSAAPSVAPASAKPSAAPQVTAPPGAGELLDLGRAENLGVIGLNTPTGVSILAVGLWRMDGVRQEPVALVELPPPWGADHFHVYGLASADGGLVLDPWLPAVYRLDVVLDSEHLGQSPNLAIGLLVRGP